MLKESDIAGMTIGQIHALECELERRRKRKPDPEMEIPRSRALSQVRRVRVVAGHEIQVTVTEHANPPAPSPRRPVWMSREEWQEHLVKNGLPVVKPFAKVRISGK
jgi:hypothetical protein